MGIIILLNQSKGFISFDAMFSIIPMLLIILYALNTVNILSETAQRNLNQQVIFNKLVSIADYTVKQGAVHTIYSSNNPTMIYPNWLDEHQLDNLDIEHLKASSDLDYLYIGLDTPSDGTCVYRLVVTGSEKSIRQLFVCGG